MCLITFAWRQHAGAALLVAANRDEFHSRPSAPAAYWEDAPQLLAGRDLEAGGTWLGVTRQGRFAAITNVRDPQAGERRGARSRGDLTRDFLTGSSAAQEYLQAVAGRVHDYLGFNLLLGDGNGLWYLHGSGAERPQPRELTPGVYGLSNAALDVPWPKVQRARSALAAAITDAQPELPSAAQLRACVTDRSLADDAALHAQGLPGEMARALSAQFIVTPAYGTRCCTTLVCRTDGSTQFTEQRFDNDGALRGENVYEVSATTTY